MSFLTNLFGDTKVDKSAGQINYAGPVSFNGGGLQGGYDQSTNKYTVGADPTRAGTIGNISDNFGKLGDAYGGLAATVAPGYNDMLRTRLAGINDSARSAIGNLQQNLQSRRVLGSSFGQDTITRGEAEFSRQRDAATSDNYLQSLNASTQLIGKQYDAYNQKYQAGLSELNLEAGMASKLSSDASSILAQNAQAQAKLNEQGAEFNAKMSNDQSSGFGSFLGKIATPLLTGGLSSLGSSIGGLFGGGSDIYSNSVPQTNGGIGHA